MGKKHDVEETSKYKYEIHTFYIRTLLKEH